MQSLREQLQKAQGEFTGFVSFFSSRCPFCGLTCLSCAADAAEVSQLRERLKGSVTLAELARKLDERNAQHDQATRELRAEARRAEEELQRRAREESS